MAIAYIYSLTEDYEYLSSIKDCDFENEWFKLSNDGKIIVKGSNKQGYAWDGCSLKFKVVDVYFGTPEGVLNRNTGQTKTYYASLVHDVLYQFSNDIKASVKRKEADVEFYNILKRDEFKLARLYYWAVRAFGWIWW